MPRPLALSNDPEVIGAIFYVMDSTIFRREDIATPGDLDEVAVCNGGADDSVLAGEGLALLPVHHPANGDTVAAAGLTFSWGATREITPYKWVHPEEER